MPPHDPTTCPQHETVAAKLDKIDLKLDAIATALAAGGTTFATLELRMASVERLVYGTVAVVLLAVGGAFVALVVKT